MPGSGNIPDKWSSEEKLAVVLETATLNETELPEYCRKKGLYSEQITEWKITCLKACQILCRNGAQSGVALGHHLSADFGQRATRLSSQN